ncbi:hypothetical protein HHI36_017726 [Cryptolaemus montrouzieri]|uniref:Uncharacterized protein n=1 Tax=Cryptolaemus montrouzieri TaxID=559131 RepID=A0ABD2NNE5_9CUCU
MSKYFRKNILDKSRKRDDSKEVCKDPFASFQLQCHQKNDKNALENYNAWLRERYEVNHKLQQKLMREPGDLLMNLSDEFNKIKEEKAALEYTRIPQHFDKYRGNPEWWEFPPGLHEKCRCGKEMMYFYQKTKVQKNEIPEIEKIGLPMYIKYEKMLIPRGRNVYKMWVDSEYRKKRIKELSPILEKIVPHRPSFDNLIVVGKRIFSEGTGVELIPIEGRMNSLSRTKRKTSIYDQSLKICLKVNGVYFYENSQSLSTSRRFHVLFEYDVQSSPLQTKHITFENVGRVTLRIHWKKMKKFKLFEDIAGITTTEFFCFDKNILTLVPGQIVNFPIWFQTRKVCTVVETWEITTIPKFWSENIRVFFVLQAQSHIENFMKKIKEIKTKTTNRVKRRIIKEIIEQTMEKTKYQDYKNINYEYFEPELFEACNFDDSSLERKPKYLYDKEIVGKLKKFYADVRQAYHPKTWDLNVGNLRILARVKDLIEYATERTCEFSKYRLMMSTQLSTHEDSNEYKQNLKKAAEATKLKKNSLTSNIEERISDPFLIKERRYGELMKLLWSLAPPSITSNKERVKYFQVYSVLCAYFTQMSIELYTVEPFNTKASSYKSHVKRERLIFEYFDELQLIRTKRIYEDNKAQPKPNVLESVSSQNIHKIHKLYFQNTAELGVSKESLKSKKKDKKELKEKGKPTLVTNNVNNTNEENLVIIDFDPYADDGLELKKISALTNQVLDQDIPATTLSDTQCKSTNEWTFQNLYVIIYSNLEKAVGAMVDTLESTKEYRVPHKNLEQLKVCFKLFIDDETQNEVPPINPFVDPEDRAYFEKILTAHLNTVTSDYLICGKTEPVIKREQASFWSILRPSVESQEELKHISKTVSVFSLPKPMPPEISFREKYAQTLPTFHADDNQPEFSTTDICKCPSEYRELPLQESEQPFYYSDDEEIDGRIISNNKISTVSKQSESFSSSGKHEIPTKKTTKVKASISLIREWSRKKCLNKEWTKQDSDKQN